MFSCKIYKELRRGAHDWEWRASSRSPRPGFLQRFGTSGSLLAGARQPEREWDTVCSQGGPGRAPAWRRAGPHAFAAVGTRGAEGCQHHALPRRRAPGRQGQALRFCIALALAKLEAQTSREGPTANKSLICQLRS